MAASSPFLWKPSYFRTNEYLPSNGGTGAEIWAMFKAAFKGDLVQVKKLVQQDPKLVNCTYDYTQPLHFAVINGHFDLVQFLVEHEADASYQNTYFGDSLVTMASDRHYDNIRDFLNKTLDEKFSNYTADANSVLDAAHNGHNVKFKLLIKTKPDFLNSCKEDGNTPLHIAAKNKNFSLVKYLIKKGANANAINKEGFKPIHWALYANNYWFNGNGDWDIARFLLENGTDFNINLAATFGDLESVKSFLDKDTSLLNFSDNCDKRPLSSAAAGGYEAIVKLLLEKGVDPNAPEAHAPSGYALFAATQEKHHNVAKLLLEYGANPNAQIEACNTPYGNARGDAAMLKLFNDFTNSEVKKPANEQKNLFGNALKNKSIKFFNAFSKGGIDDFVQAFLDNDLTVVEEYLSKHPSWGQRHGKFLGEGALAQAASRQNFEMMKLLLKYGVKTPKMSSWGKAYAFKHLDATRLLLENGMSPNHHNWLNRTVLHEFAHAGDTEKVKLLIEFGADLNVIDMEYQSTPLGLAAKNGQAKTVEILLKAGANPRIPESPPWASPKAWAKQKGHGNIERLIGKHLESTT